MWSVTKSGIVLFGYITLQYALQLSTERNCDIAELWSGVGNICQVGCDRGHESVAFDLVRVPGITNVPGDAHEDITTESGFLKAMHHVLSLRPGGLLWLAPDCSSVTFPNSSRNKRRVGNFFGNEAYRPVELGNCMAISALFLVQLALHRAVHVCLENSAGSMIWSFLRL